MVTIAKVRRPLGVILEEREGGRGVEVLDIDPRGNAAGEDVLVGDRVLMVGSENCAEDDFDTVAGRIGASMAAEIGTMRVTEQVDALTTLSTNPFKYLVAPRVIAGLTMLPLLVFVADIIGVLGGYLVSVYSLGFNAANYLQSTFDFMETLDVVSGLVKAAVFGMIITVMGCYFLLR